MLTKNQNMINRILTILTYLIIFFTYPAKAYSQEIDTYRLNSDDVISVTVFNEPDLSIDKARIGAAGTITMPLIGSIEVKDMTIDEVKEKITKLYLDGYLKKPDISVMIVEYRQFYVNGEVDKPGGFSFREGMTVERAITLAGGFTGRASKDKIYIVREDSKGVPISAKLTTLIRPGDVITVEESFF